MLYAVMASEIGGNMEPSLRIKQLEVRRKNLKAARRMLDSLGDSFSHKPGLANDCWLTVELP